MPRSTCFFAAPTSCRFACSKTASSPRPLSGETQTTKLSCATGRMLCMTCTCMLRGGTGQQWTGTYDLTFKHHSRTEALRRAKQAGCFICSALVQELRHEIDLLDDCDISIAASLAKIKEHPKSSFEPATSGPATHSHRVAVQTRYRLSFVLQKKRTRTFVLLQSDLQRETQPRIGSLSVHNGQDNSFRHGPWKRTPKSFATSSDEVFDLANQWISTCNSNCNNGKGCMVPAATIGDEWYPKRLIKLEEVKKANGLDQSDSLMFFSKHSNLERVRVKLVEPGQVAKEDKENPYYVTLSHCWGKPRSVQGQLKLTTRTEARFKTEGIQLRELPRTLQDAILFASRLKTVGYIWIDSLCIKQGATDSDVDLEDSRIDWLDQSRVMDKVYHHAYLNISATAAVDGDQGLFFSRRPEELWEDEINLNVTGLLDPQEAEVQYSLTALVGQQVAASRVKKAVGRSRANRAGNKRAANTDPEERILKRVRRIGTDNPFATPRSREHVGADFLRRCIIVDVAFWDDLLEQAPVNRRAWVLQERIMAPRVLHFCRNQIAWECSGFQDAEGYPEGEQPLMIKYGDIVAGGRVKDLTPKAGRELRQIRLRGFEDPDKAVNNIYIYELWKRVVEMYSRTSLTFSSDKLIALSGVARHFSQWTKCKYAAGLWMEHLESQLLWYVNDEFVDGFFENTAKRDPFRAPSFSWASLDTPNGITYGDVTDYKSDPDELLFKYTYHYIPPVDGDNPFGMIETKGGPGFVQLKPQYLRKIKLRKLPPSRRVPYCWSLCDGTPDQNRLEHCNVYLDAPTTDLDIFEDGAKLYCMPAAYGERTVKKSSRSLMCLLLKLTDEKMGIKDFKRFGLTKLCNYTDQRSQVAVMAQSYSGNIKIY